MNDPLNDRGARARAELNRIVGESGRVLPSAETVRRRAARRRVVHRVMAVSLAGVVGSVGLLVSIRSDEGSTVVANRPPVGSEESITWDVVTEQTTTTLGTAPTTTTTAPGTTTTTGPGTTTTTGPGTTTTTGPGTTTTTAPTTTTTTTTTPTCQNEDSAEEPSESGVTDPATGDPWRELSAAPIAARVYHAAVWTGREMVVWGGNSPWGRGNELADGAAYDPKLDSWRLIAASPLSARAPVAAVWTGTEMVIWGGLGSAGALADGAAYNPRCNSWRMLPKSPLSARVQVAAVWTGRQVIIWGGTPLGSSNYHSDGAAYDPASGEWTPLSAPPELRSGSWTTAVWAGKRLLVWTSPGPVMESWKGASYDPDTRTWQAISPAPPLMPSSWGYYTTLANSCMVWTGRSVITGVTSGDGPSVGVYEPETGQWRITPSPLVGSCGYSRDAFWAGDRMIVWGGARDDPRSRLGAAYDPDGDRWQTFDGPDAELTSDDATVWTGEELLVWSGSVAGKGMTTKGYGYRPSPW